MILDFHFQNANSSCQRSLQRVANKIKLTLQSLCPATRFIGENKQCLVYRLTLKQKKKIEQKISTLWTFKQTEVLQLNVEMIDEHNELHQPTEEKPIGALLTKMNRQSFLGTYYSPNKKPCLICFRTKFRYQGIKQLISAKIFEIYQQLSLQFTKFAFTLKMVKGEDAPGADKVQCRLIRLRHLKQEFEKNRKKRDKSFETLDLLNVSIKIVDQVIEKLGYSRLQLKNYKMAEICPEKLQLRCGLAYEMVKQEVNKYQQQVGKIYKAQQIVKGIQISHVLHEEYLGEGGYSIIYKGKYIAALYPTINPYSAKKMTQEELQFIENQQRQLVRKAPKSSQDISFQNQLNFLTYIRNQKNRRLSGYYLPRQVQRSQKQQKIYINFYKRSLYDACYVQGMMTQLQILQACLGIIEGMCFLSSKNIVHRDLKETNILVNDQRQIKIIDFGSACSVYKQKPLPGSYQAVSNQRTFLVYSVMPTKGYYSSYSAISPNSFIGKKYTREQYQRAQTFDMYALGVMITNLFQLKHESKDSMVYRQLIFLAAKCRQTNPADRYTAHEALLYMHQIIQLYKACQENYGHRI